MDCGSVGSATAPTGKYDVIPDIGGHGGPPYYRERSEPRLEAAPTPLNSLFNILKLTPMGLRGNDVVVDIPVIRPH